MGLEDTDLSEARVWERTKAGGHHVPRRAIEENFFGNLEKVNHYYALIDDLIIVDSSGRHHVELAKFSEGTPVTSVPYNELPEWFVKYLPALAAQIKQ